MAVPDNFGLRCHKPLSEGILPTVPGRQEDLYQFVHFIVPTWLIKPQKLLDFPFRMPHSPRLRRRWEARRSLTRRRREAATPPTQWRRRALRPSACRIWYYRECHRLLTHAADVLHTPQGVRREKATCPRGLNTNRVTRRISAAGLKPSVRLHKGAPHHTCVPVSWHRLPSGGRVVDSGPGCRRGGLLCGCRCSPWRSCCRWLSISGGVLTGAVLTHHSPLQRPARYMPIVSCMPYGVPQP